MVKTKWMPHMTGKKHAGLKLQGNSNAKKNTRKVELGWLHCDGSRYVQMKKKRGGGTRRVDVSKSATSEDIVRRATQLFFPGGKSQVGPLSSMTCHLRDFTESVFDMGDQTLGNYYETTMMPVLRFYLATNSTGPSAADSVAPIDSDDSADSVTVVENTSNTESQARPTSSTSTTSSGVQVTVFRMLPSEMSYELPACSKETP